MIFLLLFLKESINQILPSSKRFYGIFFVIFLFQFEKKYRAGGPAKRNIKLGWSNFVIQ